MAKDQKGFIVYGDNEPLFDRLTDEEAGQLLKAMMKYFNNGKEPEFESPLTDIIWIQVKLQMNRNADKYKKKCEKNRESIKNYWDKIKENTNEYERIRTYTNATNKDKDRDRDKNRDRDKDKESVPDVSSLPSFLISYLNEKAGTNYNVTKSVRQQVEGLIDSGYSADQIRTVIDRKCDEWLTDEKMRTYLRPSTLFGEKFGEYVSAPVSLSMEKQQDTERKRKSLQKELSEKKSSLSVLRSALDEIPRGTRMDERRTLKEQIAALEDSIGIIEGRLA